MVTAAIWPALDYSRVPYRLYHDAEIYAREQERIFRGPAWNFLGLEAEIPEPGRFPRHLGRRHAGRRQSRQGRARSRPSSTAAPIAARWCGASCPATPSEHICIYHQWCYGLDGGLTAIPFRRGIRGKGGLDPSFDMRGARSAPAARRHRSTARCSARWPRMPSRSKTISAPPILAQLRRLLDRPVRVLGYNRQRIRGNWKLYAENTRDNYHASLLHEFLVTFGLDRSTQVGGVKMDARHRHNITWAEADSDTDELRAPGLCRRAGAQRLSCR